MSVVLRAFDPVGDVGLLHRWMQAPHVEPWWELAGDVTLTEDYLRDIALAPHQEVWIAETAEDGAAFGYVETYRVADDVLADHYDDATPGDRGFHVLVGEADALGTPLTRALGTTVVGRLLTEDGADRVLCEPDVRNARMLAWCERLGGTRIATLAMPEKTAALYAWTAAS